MPEPYRPAEGAIITTADQWRKGDKWRRDGIAEWHECSPFLSDHSLIELLPAPREVTITLTEDDARVLADGWCMHARSWPGLRGDTGSRIAEAIQTAIGDGDE